MANFAKSAVSRISQTSVILSPFKLRSRLMSRRYTHWELMTRNANYFNEHPNKLAKDLNKPRDHRETETSLMLAQHRPERMDEKYYKSPSSKSNDQNESDESPEHKKTETQQCRMDVLHYKPSERHLKEYTQTWVEYPEGMRAVKAMKVKQTVDIIKPKLPKRDPKDCPVTARTIVIEGPEKLMPEFSPKEKPLKKEKLTVRRYQQPQLPMRRPIGWK